MNRTVRLDVPVLLPEVKDLQDRCIARLVSLLEGRDGVERVHVVAPVAPAEAPAGDGARATADATTVGEICLHYDPERLGLAQIVALARAAGAEVSDQFGHALLSFRMVGSEDEGQRIEDGLRGVPGVTAASVNLAAQSAGVEFDRRVTDLSAIKQRLAELGPSPVAEVRAATPAATPAAPSRLAPDEPERVAAGPAPTWLQRNREMAWSLTAGALLVASWLIERRLGRSPVTLGLYLGAYFFGARDNVGHFLADLRRGRFHFNIDLLMVVAAAGAAALGAWSEGALLLFLFSLGHALEHYALGRARNAIKALAELAPQAATVIRAGREVQVPIAEVRRDDLVVVKPAERIPVDGLVKEGRSSVNQAPITGESVPVEKTPGGQVFAGTVNGEGALVVSVTAAVGDRTLDRVIKLVAEAQTQKAPTQQFTDRFERVFVPLVLAADVLLIVVPPLVGFWTWPEAFYRAMTLLVAASPCALALGTPAAVLAGIAQAARNGVLIKGGAHLEALGGIKVLALDKTGTITKGEPAVTDVVASDDVNETLLLASAAAAEARSQHPLARAVIAEAEKRAIPFTPAGEVESVTGFGVRASLDGAVIEVGHIRMFEDGGTDGSGGRSGRAPGPPVPAAIRETVSRLESAGRTTVVVRHGRADLLRPGDGWLGVIGIADEPRPGVRETLDQLRALGITRVVMLTGDNAGVGEAIGRAVGVDEVRAGLLPEDKVAAIKELSSRGPVAMVGDGVNDAPALAHATVGIAMGGAGTAAALETADVALMGDDLGRLPFAIGLSRQARAVIRQNLAVSLGVITLLVVTSVLGLVRIGVAVILHEGSTLVVIANGLRLLAYGRRLRPGTDA